MADFRFNYNDHHCFERRKNLAIILDDQSVLGCKFVEIFPDKVTHSDSKSESFRRVGGSDTTSSRAQTTPTSPGPVSKGLKKPIG